MEKEARIYLAGHTGLVGSALLKNLKSQDHTNILVKPHQELDLTDQKEVEALFKKERPQYVFLSAAKVGGIQANINYPAQFIYENLAIQNNIIHSAYRYEVKKLLFFGSACMYPKNCPQPMKEDYLLTGKPEPTNEPYALAKIAGAKLCEAYNRQYGTNFICPIPANIYGPSDHFESEDSHVIPALISKFHKAKLENLPSVTIWGTGNPRREFIFVDDVASAAIFLMNNYDGLDFINLGLGSDVSIRELVRIIKEVVEYKGEVIFDQTKPDGILRKFLDSSRLFSLGWKPKISLEQGLKITYQDFLKHESRAKIKV
jgi:GDP-L-fucose synthase